MTQVSKAIRLHHHEMKFDLGKPGLVQTKGPLKRCAKPLIMRDGFDRSSIPSSVRYDVLDELSRVKREIFSIENERVAINQKFSNPIKFVHKQLFNSSLNGSIVFGSIVVGLKLFKIPVEKGIAHFVVQLLTRSLNFTAICGAVIVGAMLIKKYKEYQLEREEKALTAYMHGLEMRHNIAKLCSLYSESVPPSFYDEQQEAA